jgi:hypothetical protein
MTTSELLDLVDRLGVKLAAAEGRLRADAPRGVLTEELRAALAENKPAILAILAGPPAAPDPRAPASEFGRWLSARVAYNEAIGRLMPARPWPWFQDPRDYEAETRRGDELRARGEAMPLCLLPD